MAAIGYILTGFIGVVIGGLIRWWNAYSDEKGKNLATKEDFNDLKEQTRQLTETTKEIESKIDNRMWDRQKQWELKRDTVIELVKVMKEFEQATMALGIAIKAKIAAPDNMKLFHQEKVSKRIAVWEPLSVKLEQHIYLATLVFGRETISALHGVAVIVRDVSSDALSEKNPDAYAARNLELVQQFSKLRDVLRDDLGFSPMFQPAGSIPSKS